jgi:hypothetical protein
MAKPAKKKPPPQKPLALAEPDFIVRHIRVPSPFEEQLSAVVKCATDGREMAVAKMLKTQENYDSLMAKHVRVRCALGNMLELAATLERHLNKTHRSKQEVKSALDLLAKARSAHEAGWAASLNTTVVG